MPNETVKVSGPVSVISDARQRVAFDLMKHIGVQCYNADMRPQGTRDYWLKLYHQCFKATNGDPIEEILKNE